jgi:hypothetical protein
MVMDGDVLSAVGSCWTESWGPGRKQVKVM